MREKKLDLLKRILPEKLKKEFHRQMSMRNYYGVLEIDHEKKTIAIQVQVDNQGAATTSGGTQLPFQSPRLPLFEQNEDCDVQSPIRSPMAQPKSTKRVMQDLKGKEGVGIEYLGG